MCCTGCSDFGRFEEIGSHFADKNGRICLGCFTYDLCKAHTLNKIAILVCSFHDAPDDPEQVESNKRFLGSKFLRGAGKEIGVSKRRRYWWGETKEFL